MPAPTYSLVNDGDGVEKACANAFLATQFPSYEEFWRKFVVPITNRPIDVHIKSDLDLAEVGKNAHDICHSQLHYTVLRHLAHCFDLQASATAHPELFIDYMVRLSSALDPADELLQRFTEPNTYDPWSEDEGARVRRKWRTNCNHQVHLVRDYRNKLLHGRINPTIILVDVNTRQQLLLGVKLDRQDAYIDWRKLTASPSRPNPDFAPLGNIMGTSWSLVLDYLETQWQAVLLK